MSSMLGRADGVFGLPDSPEGLQLAKALQAGSGAGLSSTGGRAIVLEDLEGVLHSVTYGTPQFENTLWRNLKEKSAKASAIMHEYSRITGRGRTGVFGPEIATVNTLDAQIDRQYAQVRFLRTVFEYSHVIGLVQKVEDQKTIQAMNATMHLTNATERYLYEGDSSMTPDEWNGLYKTVSDNAPTHILDVGGSQLTKAHLLNASQTIAGNFGIASHMFMPLHVQRSLDGILEGDKDRVLLTDTGKLLPAAYMGPNSAVMYGAPSAGLRTSFGNILFKPHLFVGFEKDLYLNQSGVHAATSANAPGTPTFSLGASVDAASGLPDATYRYRVEAENSAGLSTAAVEQTVTTSGGEHVTVTITAGTGTPTAYRVFRSTPGGASATIEYIGRVADSSGSATFTDKNQRRAGTFRAFVMDLQSPGALSSVAWAQLAPMSTYELPMGDTYFRNMLFMYGVLTVYAPKKIFILDNIAVDSGTY